MMTKRLDNVLDRQKKNLALDTLFAAVLVVGLGLAALALWVRLPSLPVSPAPTASTAVQLDDSPEQVTAYYLAERPSNTTLTIQ
jgi:hypothetical protein